MNAPLEFVDSLKGRQHLALFYEDYDNSKMIEYKFIKNGLDNDEHCVYATTEDHGIAILEMLRQEVSEESIKKLLRVFKIPNPFDDPDGSLVGCKNNIKMILSEIISPFRIIARLVPNVSNIEGMTTELNFEEYVHKNFNNFDGMIICPYELSEIETSQRKDWLRGLYNNHHTIIHIPKNEMGGVFVPSRERIEQTKLLWIRQDLTSILRDVTNTIVSFSHHPEFYCVSIVDMVNSTHITSKMPYEQCCEYYGIFLNSMSVIVKQFNGKVIKNIGDSLLFYFPKTSNDKDRNAFKDVIECGMTMIKARELINQKLIEKGLPDIDFRISADYGRIMMADSAISFNKDIFGSPVNVCSRINSCARPNGMVVGGDLYQFLKKEKDYLFYELKPCNIGHLRSYSVYEVAQVVPKKVIFEL